jgi:hypothetical protein
LRQTLVKIVLENPNDILTSEKNTKIEFEKSLNLQEIIYSVIHNQEITFLREFLKDHFPLGDFFTIIDKSIDKLDVLQLSDEIYDAQDYDELKEHQYIAIINIYTQLYLSINYSDTDPDILLSAFNERLVPEYIKRIEEFTLRVDLNNTDSYKRSEMKFLIDYMQNFFISIKRFIEVDTRDDFKRKFKGGSRKSFSTKGVFKTEVKEIIEVREQMGSIEEAFNNIISKLERFDNEEVKNIINVAQNQKRLGNQKKDGDEDNPLVHAMQTMKFNNSREENQLSTKRNEESNNLHKAWRNYVETLVADRNCRQMIDEEHQQLAQLIFDTMTSQEESSLAVQSYKSFLKTSIDYVYKWEKANWTLYIIIFIFKLNSMILDLWDEEMDDNASTFLKSRINARILDSFDTVRTSSMIFKILSTSEDEAHSHNIFGMTSYFLCKLLSHRPKSWQQKFLGFFKNDSTSEHFFQQWFTYLNVHKAKLSKGSLRELYKSKNYTDELSNACYLVDKNLEKQIVRMLRMLCFNSNAEMQNYMREQTNSTISYNMVSSLTQYAFEFLDHLQYPVAFDIFQNILDTLEEFVQGPNPENQEILVQHHFIELCNAILNLDYNEEMLNKIDDVETPEEMKKSVASVKGESLKNKSLKSAKSVKFNRNKGLASNPASNFMTSLAKYKCLIIMMQLLVGREATSYIYYLYRRVLDPEMFRLNFAYQAHFIRRFHKNDYSMDLFFRYDSNINENLESDNDGTLESPLIVEIGFQLYFLLMSMRNNFNIDFDEKYYRRLYSLMAEKSEASSNIETNVFVSGYKLMLDLCNLCSWRWGKKNQGISIDRVYQMKNDDSTISDILEFFSEKCSKIEIVKDGTLLCQFFPILPFCEFTNNQTKDKFK